MVGDRASKLWALNALADGTRIPIIGHFVDLELTTNPGAAFGILRDATIFVFFTSAALVIGISIWAWISGEAGLFLGLIVGGGVGNLIDRVVNEPGVFRGEVIDFIDASFWPTFNLADSAIVVGALLMLLKEIRRKEPSESQSREAME